MALSSSTASVEEDAPPDGPAELAGSSAATSSAVTLVAPPGNNLGQWKCRKTTSTFLTEGVHNTASLWVKQLVLELKLRVRLLELTQRFLRSFTRSVALPLDQEFPGVCHRVHAHHLLLLWQGTTLHN
jgi:hypothetical protein